MALLRALAAEADVVVENFRPGTLERRGLWRGGAPGGEPALVWCTITGFGPGSERPGYDFVVQAESGWMSITGEPDGAPMKHGVALADVLAGKDAAIAILGALVARAGTGRRPAPCTSRSKASAEAALVNVAQNALVSGAPPDAMGKRPREPGAVPAVRRGRSSAGDRRRERRAVAGMRSRARTRRAGDRARPAHERGPARRSATASCGRSPTRVRERAGVGVAATGSRRAGVPCGVVRSVLEVLADRQRDRALTGMPPSVPGAVRRPPPRLGEHSALVRARGWDAFADDGARASVTGDLRGSRRCYGRPRRLVFRTWRPGSENLAGRVPCPAREIRVTLSS